MRISALKGAAASKEPHVARSIVVLMGGSILPELRMEFDTHKYVSVVNEVACDHGHGRPAAAAKCLKTRLAASKVGK